MRCGSGSRHVFPIVDIPTDALADSLPGNRDNVSQETVPVWKKVQVRVERKAVLALFRNDDDEPPFAYASEFGDRTTYVEYVLEDVRANDGVETTVRERQKLDWAFDQIDSRSVQPSLVIDLKVDPRTATRLPVSG